MTRKMITAMLCALLCLPMVAGAASTPISQTPDAGTLTGTEKIPIGRVGGTTAISTTTGALLNRANHTGTQAATTVAEDSTHRFATDAEKSAWNAKQAAYSVLTTLGGLSHASGWLKNDGAGALSYATPAKADVGLGNVDNTSDANKPVSTAVQTALNAKAPLAAPTFTDSVTAPSFNSTAADGYHYIRPYNSVAFAGTALAGMFVTTPTGPQWYTGSEWEAIGGDSLPSQAGNSGKYLTTNGTAASWGTIAAGSELTPTIISTSTSLSSDYNYRSDATSAPRLTVPSTASTLKLGVFTRYTSATLVPSNSTDQFVDIASGTEYQAGYSVNVAANTLVKLMSYANDGLLYIERLGGALTEGVYEFVASLGLSPGSFGFGDVTQNTTSAAQTFTITNSGAVDATNIAATLTTGTNFTLTGSSQGTPASIGTIAAGGSATVSATFSPTAVQSYSDTLNISGTGITTITAALTGNGIAGLTQQDSFTTIGTGTNVGAASANAYRATSFTAATSYSMTQVRVPIYKTGTPTGLVHCYVYNDNGSDAPNTATVVEASNTFAAADITSVTTGGTYYTFNLSKSITSGSKYWIAIRDDVVDASNYYKWFTSGSQTGYRILRSADGTTWAQDSATTRSPFQVWGY